MKPRYISEKYKAAVLFKICPTLSRIEDFVKGRLYMNTNLFFSENEEKSCLTNDQYDFLEGTQTLLNNTKDIEVVMDYLNGKATILQGKRGEFKHNGVSIYNVQLGRNRPNNIYCLYSIWYGCEDGIITKVDERIKTELGEYFAMILNKKEFLNRIDKAAKTIPYKLKSDIKYDFVNYVTIKDKPYVKLGVFNKDERYMYQNEFRIALELDKEPGPLKYFEIGDLSDIVVVGKTELLFNIEYKDNSIKIGDINIPIKWI